MFNKGTLKELVKSKLGEALFVLEFLSCLQI